MSILNITIKGLALCRPVGLMTEILFPHAPKHRLQLTIKKGPESIVEDIFAESFITMNANGGVKTTPASGAHNLIDLRKWHQPQGSLPVITLKDRNDVRKRMSVSYLSIPTVEISSKTVSGNEYDIWIKKSAPGQNPTRTYQENVVNGLYEEAQMSFSLPAAGTTGALPALTLKFESPLDHSYEFTHAVDSEDTTKVLDYDLIFDNHCDGLGGGSDFGYYYEMIEAINLPTGEKYEIEEFFAKRPRALSSQSDSEAACNVVLGDPLPQGPGSLADWHKTPKTP